MTITREQVADLQPGDVVEVHRVGWPEGVTVSGALYGSGEGGAKGLWVGDLMVRFHDGDVFAWQVQEGSTLTVVSRAPRPLYVNHPRTEPVPGDVVRDADDDEGNETWAADGNGGWLTIPGAWLEGNRLPDRLRLLVDGETGQVVR